MTDKNQKQRGQQGNSTDVTVAVVSGPSYAVKEDGQRHRPTSPTVYINMGGQNSKSMAAGEDSRTARFEHNSDRRWCESGGHGIRRKWTTHAGRNRFFCNGRFVVARQSSVFLLTLFLLLLTTILFCVFDLPFLTLRVGFVLPIVSAALFFLVLSSLLKTALTDPGILPRASPREVLEWERQCQETDPFFHRDEWAQPRTRIIHIEGQPIKLKYCFSCCIFRPPRSSHCSICDNCVLNFDHHCPWLGNCIGLRNYRHFYMFITTLSLLDAFMGICVGFHLYLLTIEKGNFMEALKESPPSMLTGLINVISIWSVLGLSGFHTYLLCLGQTTNEDIKGTFNRKLHPQVKNPYSKGNCLKNIFSVLCAPERPSLLDRRGWLPPEEGPVIFINAELMGKLSEKENRSIQQQRWHYTSLNAPRGGSNRSVASLASIGEVRTSKRKDQSPSSPTRKRRGNNNVNTFPNEHAEKQQKFKEKPNNLPGNNSMFSLDRGHRTLICHGNNLVVPVNNISTKDDEREHEEESTRGDEIKRWIRSNMEMVNDH